MTGLRDVRTGVLAAITLSAMVWTCTGCAGNREAVRQQDFRHHTLGVETLAPRHPEVRSRMLLTMDAPHPVLPLVEAGAEVMRQLILHGFEARMDSAARYVDLPMRMGDRVLRNGARQLQARPVGDFVNPDYELQIRVRNYGITISSWTSVAYFMIDAELRLLDGTTGRSLWEARVRATDPMRSLAAMSTGEIQLELQTLADFAADNLVGSLAAALD